MRDDGQPRKTGSDRVEWDWNRECRV